jgi:glyoxylase-like metal-dependent hydrolase (beta-lactamase superfamily II)
MNIDFGGGSKVVFIEETNRQTLIDTGFDNEELGGYPDNVKPNRQILISALRVHEYSIKDMTRVFITHWHFGNLNLSREAERLKAKYFIPANKGYRNNSSVISG